MNLIKSCKFFNKFIFSKIYIMNKNNIFNFVKYAIFAGILYFVIKKIPAINIGEYEILMLIVIIGAGMYSYECLLDGFISKDNKEGFADNFSKLDDSLELDVNIDDEYSKLDRGYYVTNKMLKDAKDLAERIRKEQEEIKRIEEERRLAEEAKRRAEEAKRIALENLRKAEEERLRRLEEKRLLEEKLRKAEEERQKRIQEAKEAERKRELALRKEIEARNRVEREKAAREKEKQEQKRIMAKRLEKLAYEKMMKAKEEEKRIIMLMKKAEEQKRIEQEKLRLAEEKKKEAEQMIRESILKKQKQEEKINIKKNILSKINLGVKSGDMPNFKVDKERKQTIPVDEVLPLSEDLDYPEQRIDDIEKTPIGKLKNKLTTTKKSLDKLRKGVKDGNIPDYNLVDDEDELIDNGILDKNVIEKPLKQAQDLLGDKGILTASRRKSKISRKFDNIEDEIVSASEDDDSVFMKPLDNKISKVTRQINNSKLDLNLDSLKKTKILIKAATNDKKISEKKILSLNNKIEKLKNRAKIASEEIKMAIALEQEADSETDVKNAMEQKIKAEKELKIAKNLVKVSIEEKNDAVEDKLKAEKELKKLTSDKKKIEKVINKIKSVEVKGNDGLDSDYEETDDIDYVNNSKKKLKKEKVTKYHIEDESEKNYILDKLETGRKKNLPIKSSKIDYRIKDESERSTDMPLVQNVEKDPQAIDGRVSKKYSGVRDDDSKKSKKLGQLNDMKRNNKLINNMISKDNNVGIFRDELDDNENVNRKLYNELIIPNSMNPEDLIKYGLNKFDIQDEITSKSGIQDYDQVFQESNFKLIDDLDSKGIVRKKYGDSGPKVLRVENTFINGVANNEKILVDPDTGKEVKLSYLEDEYVKVDNETGRKYVLIENEDNSGSVKKIYIDDSGSTEIIDDPRLDVKTLSSRTEKPKLLAMGDKVGLDDYSFNQYNSGSYFRKTEDILDDYRHDYRRKMTADTRNPKLHNIQDIENGVYDENNENLHLSDTDLSSDDVEPEKVLKTVLEKRPDGKVVKKKIPIKSFSEASKLILDEEKDDKTKSPVSTKKIFKIVYEKNSSGEVVKRKIPVNRIDGESEYLIEDPANNYRKKVIVSRTKSGALDIKMIDMSDKSNVVKSKKSSAPAKVNVKKSIPSIIKKAMKKESKLKKSDPNLEKEDVIPSIIRSAKSKSNVAIKKKPVKKTVKKVFRDLKDIEDEEIYEGNNISEIEEDRNVPSVLEISFKLENIEYDELSESQKSSIKQDVRARYAVNLGISRKHIEVDIARGSVIVNVKIYLDQIRESKIEIAKKMVEYNDSVKEEIVNTVSSVTDNPVVGVDDKFPDMVVKEMVLDESIESEDINRQTVKKKTVATRKKAEASKNAKKSKAVSNKLKTTNSSNEPIDNEPIDSQPIDSEIEDDNEQIFQTIDSEEIPSAVKNKLDGIDARSEIRKLRKETGPRPVPNMKINVKETPNIKIKSKSQLDKEEKEIIKKLEEEQKNTSLSMDEEGLYRRRSPNEIKEIKKELRKKEKEMVVQKLKDNIEGKPVFDVKKDEPKVIIRDNVHHHHDDSGLNCKTEVSKMRKDLNEEINKLKEQLKESKKKKRSGTVDDIEKRNVKILLKELLANKILTKEEVEDIYDSAKKGDVDLKELISALEKLRDTTSYSFPKSTKDSTVAESKAVHHEKVKRVKSDMYGDMKYDELPVDKRIPLGDQLPPDDWDNEYTLLNTDKWAVPRSNPPVCVASNNMDPLPSNEAGYPMLLKEWDNSRVISNSYINKKWAMDQVDSSGF